MTRLSLGLAAALLLPGCKGAGDAIMLPVAVGQLAYTAGKAASKASSGDENAAPPAAEMSRFGATRAKPIVDVPPGPRPKAPSDAALVTFIRPSDRATDVELLIFDHLGRYVGHLPPASYFTVALEANEYVFFPDSDNGMAFEASVRGGHTYAIKADVWKGSLGTRADLVVVEPDGDDAASMAGWLAKAKQVVPDRAKGQVYVDSHADKIRDRAARGLTAFVQFDKDQKKAHSITSFW